MTAIERSNTLLLAVLSFSISVQIAAAFAQSGAGDPTAWPPTSDALEACIMAEERDLATGQACIGRSARECLKIAEREPIVHAEKCYGPEVAAWARLMKRYFDERPQGAKGKRVAEVQRAWLAYRELKCGYSEFHHGGPERGHVQKLICLMEETGRRAIELRSLRESR